MIVKKFGILFLALLIIISCKREFEIDGISKVTLNEKLEEAYSIEINSYDLRPYAKIAHYLSVNNTQPKSTYHKALNFYLRAMVYSTHSNNLQEAENDILLAQNLFKTLPHAELELALCYNDLANIVGALGREDEIIPLYKKAIVLYKKNNSIDGLLETYYNMAGQYYYTGKLIESKKLCEEALTFNSDIPTRKNLKPQFYVFLGEIALQEGNLAESEILLSKALKSIGLDDPDGYYFKNQIYKALAQIFLQQNKVEQAFHYNELRIEAREQHLQTKDIESKDYIKTFSEVTLQLYKQKLKVIEQQNKIILIIGLLFLINIAYLIFIFRQQAKLRKKTTEIVDSNLEIQNLLIDKEDANKKLKKEKEKVEKLLLLNQRTLFSKELKISTTKDSLTNILNEFKKIIESESAIEPTKLLHIEKKLFSMIESNEKTWNDFKTQFEKIRPKFFSNLKKEYPQLTINELKHCSYIVSNLNTKEVAQLVNMSPRSVETVKYRMKKKLGLKSGENLIDFLQKF